jgi:hypothetical protein
MRRHRIAFAVSLLIIVLVVRRWFLTPEHTAVSTIPYEAPFSNPNADPKDIIPNQYSVYLAPDYSLDQHIATIGRDIKPFVAYVSSMGSNKVIYWCRDVTDDLLQLIRSDRRVEMVDYNYKVYLDKS